MGREIKARTDFFRNFFRHYGFLLGNPKNNNVKLTLIGQPAHIKVSANIGTSPLENSSNKEIGKLKIVYEASADTVMDLSTG